MPNKSSPRQKAENGGAKERRIPKLLHECDPERLGYGMKWDGMRGYYKRTRRTKAQKLATCKSAQSNELSRPLAPKQRRTRVPEPKLPPRVFTADPYAPNSAARAIRTMDSTLHIDNDRFCAQITLLEPALLLVPVGTEDTNTLPTDPGASCARTQGDWYAFSPPYQFIPPRLAPDPSGYQEEGNVNHDWSNLYAQMSADLPATVHLFPETLLSGGYIPPSAGIATDQTPRFYRVSGSGYPVTSFEVLDQYAFDSFLNNQAWYPGMTPTYPYFSGNIPDDSIL